MAENFGLMDNKTLIKLPDDLIDRMGAQVAGALKSKRGKLLCERDGHPDSFEMEFGVCLRCGNIVDEAKWEKTKTEAGVV